MTESTSLPMGAKMAPLEGVFLRVHQAIAAEDWDTAVALAHGLARDSQKLSDSLALMAVISYETGDLVTAISALEQAQHHPNASTDIPEVLAVLYALVGRLQDALFYGKLATAKPLDGRIMAVLSERFPVFADVFLNISPNPVLNRALLLADQGLIDSAREAFLQQLSLEPKDKTALRGLESIYQAKNQPRDQLHVLRLLRLLEPENAFLASRTGQALARVGDAAAGLACHRAALDMAPDDSAVHAALLLDLAGSPDAGLAALADARRAWLKTIRPAGAAKAPVLGAEPKPLKVGYLCGGLRDPADIEMLALIVAAHRRDVCKPVVFGWGDIAAPMNKLLRPFTECWRDVQGIDEMTLAALMRGERVDVLVDVAGFTQTDQYGIFMLRAAPVQVGWLGMSPGVALPGADWRFSHAALESADLEAEVPAWNLPHGPRAFTSILVPGLEPPAKNFGAITFGADAALAELTPATIGLWSRVLVAVADSRLLLRDRGFGNEEDNNRIIGLFSNMGMMQRVEVITTESDADFLADIDMMLAPFPSADARPVARALANGVPTLALDCPGRKSQQAVAVLDCLGYRDRMVASSESDFIGKSVSWASDAAGLAAFRTQGRGNAALKGLMDPAAFTVSLEDAYLAMWRKAAGK